METSFSLASLEKSLGADLSLDKEDVIYVTGSTVEGLADAVSDLDIVIVTNNQDHNGFERAKCISSNCNVEVITFEELKQLAKQVLELSQAQSQTFPLWEIIKCFKLLIGQPLYNEIGFLQLQELFTWRNIYSYLISDYLRGMNAFRKDALARITIGDKHTSALCARYSLEYAIDAVLVTKGDWNPKPKWRWKKMERSLSSSYNVEMLFGLIVPHANFLYQPQDYVETCCNISMNLGNIASAALNAEPVYPVLLSKSSFFDHLRGH